MYDESGGGSDFRSYCSANLAWWHTYKHAAFTLWTKFSDQFWAPFFHHMYPSVQFYPKEKKFPKVLLHMQIVRMAYPEVKDEIAAALASDTVASNDKTLLKDFRFLCEFAIPSVRN